MKLKEWLEKIGIGVATSLIVLVLTAVIKGESLNGLLKISGLFHFLKTGVPLWLFLITLIAGLLGSLQWKSACYLKTGCIACRMEAGGIFMGYCYVGKQANDASDYIWVLHEHR